MEIPEVWEGGKPKKPSVGGVWIFSGTTHFENIQCPSYLTVREI